VLETYRRGIAEYGVPKEMLTDNGRQYTNWRGKTRFEREMKKDRVKHIRSRPHHPMTLGKIERFWKSILGEFLQRAQFDSFEQAVERTAFWVKYYNYKRPHQGIGGLCPADRFFEIAHDLKKTLEKGVEENVLELALARPPGGSFLYGGPHGRPVAWSSGRKRAKSRCWWTMPASRQKELVYDARKDIDHEDKPTNPQSIRTATENHGRVVDLERAAHERAGVPGVGHQPDAVGPVAEPGHRGHAQSAGPEEERSPAADQPPAVTADRKEAGRPERSWRSVSRHPESSRPDSQREPMPKQPSTQQTARLRAEMIMKVRCGLLTARQAAARMGVSRKTFYKWEQRGLERPARQCDRPASGTPSQSFGRPSPILEKQLFQANREIDLLNHKMALKDVLMELKLPRDRQRPGEKKMSVSSQAVAMIEKAKTKFSLSYACCATRWG
jgi:transposase